MKVTDWCRDHGISKANYYYRLRQVRRAYLALSMIQAIFREEKILKELPAEEREKRRQVSVRPLVEACFEWLKENIRCLPKKGKT